MKKSTPDPEVHDLYDRGYKLILSFYQVFQQLMEGYVPKEWISRLDYANSQKIDKSFIMKGFKKQESDILYKVPLLGEPDKTIFLYVLIEHQSNVDFTMPFRVLCYLVEIWRDFYKNTKKKESQQKDFRFPPVFPIVLYNGKNTWTASTSMREIVEHAELFGDFIPNVCYHLVDIPRLDKTKLEKLENSLSALFLLERDIPAEEFDSVLKQAIEYILGNATEEMAKAFKDVILALFSKKINETELNKIIEQIALKPRNKKEIQTMLEMMPQKLRDLGRQEGTQNNIIQLLKIRIGPVSEVTKTAIQNIKDEEKLNQLFTVAAKVEKMSEFTTKLRELK